MVRELRVSGSPGIQTSATQTLFWWSQPGSNRRPPACKAGALPAELWPRQLVGLGRFELPTSPLSGVRSNLTELQTRFLPPRSFSRHISRSGNSCGRSIDAEGGSTLL